MTRVTDGSQMETPGDKVDESAPCEAVKMEAEANTTNKIEETKYGLDEVEEADENEGDENEGYSSEGVENEEIENEDIENDNIKNEEIEYEDEENQEVTADSNNKADEDEYEEEDVEENEKTEEVVTEEMDSKEADGKLQSLAADVIEAGKDEIEKAVKDSATEDSIPGKKAKMARRKATTNVAVSKKAVKAGGKVGSGFVSVEKGIEENDQTMKSITLNLVPKTRNTEVGNVREGKEVADSAAEKVTSGFGAEEKSIKKDGGTVKSITLNLVPKTKNTKVENGEEGKEVTGSAAEEKEIIPIKKAKRARRRATTNATTSEKTDKADELRNAGNKEASAAVKEVKRVDGMGMIFMCNAKTKQDCFRFKVLGLPASQKELVTKIYTGMRLFLFDVDLKLMYGIFKAVTPGGYNIEPKAFNSAYPAQVRFKVFDDCLPLPEEKFKVALKENYYGRNKFNNQLSQQQVKKLCNLFQKTSKRVKRKRPRAEIQITEQVLTPTSKRLRTGARRNDAVSSARAEPKPIRDRVHNNTRHAREPIRMEPVHQQSRTHHHRRSQHGRSGRRTPPAPLPSRRERSPPLRQRRESPPPRGIRAQDMDPYRRHRDAYVSSAPSAAAAPYDYYYRHEAPPPAAIDHRAVLRDMQASEYDRDAYNSMYGEPPHGRYLDAYYASSLAAAAAGQPAYATLPPQASYAPPMHEHIAYGGHPYYYRY